MDHHRITFYGSERHKSRLKTLAARDDRSPSSYLRTLIDREFDAWVEQDKAAPDHLHIGEWLDRDIEAAEEAAKAAAKYGLAPMDMEETE